MDELDKETEIQLHSPIIRWVEMGRGVRRRREQRRKGKERHKGRLRRGMGGQV